MQILLLNQFYPPDVAPTGQVLHDLARVLVARGNQVRVVCSRRSYDGWQRFPARETLDGVEILRLPALGFGRRGFLGKTADYSSFCGALLWKLAFLRPRPDLILALTTPPYVGLLAMLAARWRGMAHAHWTMDLYPDVLAAHGMLNPRGLLFRTLRRLTRTELRGSRLVLALGPHMATRAPPYLEGLDAATLPASWNDRWSLSWPVGYAAELPCGTGGFRRRLRLEWIEVFGSLVGQTGRWSMSGALGWRGEGRSINKSINYRQFHNVKCLWNKALQDYKLASGASGVTPMEVRVLSWASLQRAYGLTHSISANPT